MFKSQVYWAGVDKSFSEDNTVSFVGRNGYLVVPVGSNINFMKKKGIAYIRIDFDQMKLGEKVELESVNLYKYDIAL